MIAGIKWLLLIICVALILLPLVWSRTDKQ